MTKYAIAKRTLQFVAGPQKTTFYACPEHKPDLDRGDVSAGLFFTLRDYPTEPVSADDEQECDLCREG